MKRNAMIVGLATILLTLVAGTFGRVAAEPTKGNCEGISEAFLVTGLPSGYCEVASTDNQAVAEPTKGNCGEISEAFLATGFPLDTTGNRSPDACWEAEGRIPIRPPAN